MDEEKISEQELEKVTGGVGDLQRRGGGVVLVTSQTPNAEDHNVMLGGPMDKYELAQ